MTGARIACLLGAGYEDSEFRIPYEKLKAAGHAVDLIGIKAGEELKGYRGKDSARTEKSIDQVKPQDYQALLIPGGQSPDHLRVDPRMVQFVKAFDALKRPLAAVCHGPQLLLSARLVKGRTLTAWQTVQGDLEQAGAKVLDQAVVTDQNWITSRKPEDLEPFSQALLEALQKEERKGTNGQVRA